MTPDIEKVVDELRTPQTFNNKGPDYEPMVLPLDPLKLKAANLIATLSGEVERVTGERDEALRRATPISTGGLEERRKAAKKLLCDICACSAETDPESLDLPHVVSDCLEPLETLMAERDASLFMATQTRRFLGQDGPMVLDAIAEVAAAKSAVATITEEVEIVTRAAIEQRMRATSAEASLAAMAGWVETAKTVIENLIIRQIDTGEHGGEADEGFCEICEAIRDGQDWLALLRPTDPSQEGAG